MAINIRYFGRVKPMYYYLRSLKQNYKLVLLASVFILLNTGALHYLFGDGDGTMPYLTFTIYGEDIKDLNGTSANLYTDYGSNTYRVESVRLLRDEEVREIEYSIEPPPDFEVMYGEAGDGFEEDMEGEESGNPIKDLFRTLKKPTGFCRKLYRAGGMLTCRYQNETSPKMDGQKIICVDPAMQVITGSPKTMDCVALSFGVNYDISFDISVRDANCEILMFDYDQFSHTIAEEDEYVNFFEIGLATERVDEYIRDQDRTLQFDSFNNLAFEHGFVDRLVNILKIDIEGDEWTVLKDMAQQPYLDTIGQIAVEVHAPFITDMNKTRKHEWVNSVMDTFKDFQKKGFRQVSYFDNINADVITSENSGEKYFSAGELLLVNSNWYRDEFRNDGIANGLKFLPLNQNI